MKNIFVRWEKHVHWSYLLLDYVLTIIINQDRLSILFDECRGGKRRNAHTHKRPQISLNFLRFNKMVLKTKQKNQGRLIILILAKKKKDTENWIICFHSIKIQEKFHFNIRHTHHKVCLQKAACRFFANLGSVSKSKCLQIRLVSIASSSKPAYMPYFNMKNFSWRKKSEKHPLSIDRKMRRKKKFQSKNFTFARILNRLNLIWDSMKETENINQWVSFTRFIKDEKSINLNDLQNWFPIPFGAHC